MHRGSSSIRISKMRNQDWDGMNMIYPLNCIKLSVRSFIVKTYRQAAFSVLALLTCTTAVGCSCIQRHTSQYYESASVVIIGKVTSTNEADLPKQDKKYVRRVSVLVQETFKGDSSNILTIEDSFNRCNLGMQKGDRVILFLHKDLLSDTCSGSAILYSNEVLRTRFGMDEKNIGIYQAKLKTRITELHNYLPKKWWQIWR